MSVNLVASQDHVDLGRRDSPAVERSGLAYLGVVTAEDHDNATTNTSSLGSLSNPSHRWQRFDHSTTFAPMNDFDIEPSRMALTQDLQSDSTFSTIVSPLDTTYNLSKYDSGVGLDSRFASPKRETHTIISSTQQNDLSLTSNVPSPSSAAIAATHRSERARNAANRRHSRAKQPPLLPAGKLAKQDIEREKNRIAAAKCRKKKRIATNALDAEYRAATAANSRMMQEHRELRDQLTCWRMLALQHLSGLNGCRCNAIHRYNTDQAMRAVSDMENSWEGGFSLGERGGNGEIS